MRSTRLAIFLALLLSLLAAPQTAVAFDNGQAPLTAVAPIASGVHCPAPQGQLANDAAAGFNTMALAAGQVIPINGCDSAYRPLDRQVFWKNWWCEHGNCGNAATPGTSNHGLGLAIDVPQWVRGYIDQHGSRFGWCKCWSDASWEWWHIKFNPGVFHRPNPGPDLANPVLRRGSGGPGQALWVRKAQRLLKAHGARELVVDGHYGGRTVHAVEMFQKAEGIKKRPGVIWKRVWKHLREPVIHPSPVPPPVPPTPKPPKPKPPKPHPKPLKGKSQGIDVSEAQGSIDWSPVSKDHIEFSIVKATEGQDWRDPTFTSARLNAIKKAGIVPGVYHFLRPRSDRPGSREATWFTQVISQAGYGRGFLPPVADIETTELDNAGTCRYLKSFLGRVEKNLKVRPIVYSYVSFVREHLAGCSILKKYKLWIASYEVSKPEVPTPWSKYTIWQYTSKGHVNGISGFVDRNVSTKRAIQAMLVKPRPKKLLKPLRGNVTAKVSSALSFAAKPPAVERQAAPPIADELPLEAVPAPEGEIKPPPPVTVEQPVASEQPVIVEQQPNETIAIVALILAALSLVTSLFIAWRIR